MKLSIVVPSYNEMKNVRKDVLEEVYAYLKKQDYEWELILSDDGSTDGTVEELKKFASAHPNTVVLDNPHKGKGPTVLAGMRASRADAILFTDFDQATPLEEIEKLLPFFHKGYDVVVGSREVKGSKRDKEPIHRHIMGKVFNMFVQLLTISGIHDTQCGFKLFSKQAANKLIDKVVIYSGKNNLNGAFTGAFDVELLFLARKANFLIAEVPILWKYVDTARVDPVRDSFRMFIDLLRIRIADWTGKYS